MNKILLSIPVVLVLIISIFLLIFLLQGKDPSKPPSALINKSIPSFKTNDLFDENKSIASIDLNNKMVLINFFASWCIPCKAEHPIFFQIKKDNPNLFILGINHKDTKEDAIKYLNDDGNPYDYVGTDKNGLIGLEFGVFGLPETFIIDKTGKIIFKYLGPLTTEIIEYEIQPLL